jgi:hypothetical protein
MTPFQAGIYREASERGLTENQIYRLVKSAQDFGPAAELFKQSSGEGDPDQLSLMAAIQDQVAAERQYDGGTR